MSMELKRLFLKSDRLSSPNCVSVSDPDEKEISDNDDNDRNHKHRRRETISHALERDSLEQTLTQPYRKRNRAFENGQSGSKFHHNLDSDFSKFEKRRNAGVNFSRFSGEHGSGRRRDRNFQRDSRFGSFDVASQMILPGSIQPAMFAGRGMPNVSNAQSAPWSSFGLLPAISNGAIDAVNPLGPPGMFKPQLNSLFNMDVQRQRCRDFEEQGFCLRGDMCPMEHGVNHIVVDDVQSLSQFNLPVSLSCGHGLGKSTGSGFIPSPGVSSGILMNNQGLCSRTSMFSVDDESLVGAANASGADVYDPDQPLWSNDGHEASKLLRFQPIHFDESDPSVDTDLSDHIIRNSGTYMGSQNTISSVRQQITHSKNKMKLNENFDSKIKPSEYPESKPEKTCEALSVSQGTSQLAKQNNGGSFGAKVAGLTFKVQCDEGANVRKPSQKAQCTLFVNCIPLKDNKKENLLAHFRKFGKVIDIYIPVNSERAFVQFSKREEAENALKAPDAVMGSRFIKLWWANRDSVRVPDEGTNSGNNVTMPLGMPHVTGTNKGKNNLQRAASKPPNGLNTAGNDLKPVAANSPKTPPSALKRMENLEVLKELRKKQEMLEEKCYAFYLELEDKLAKQATGQVSSGHPATKQKVGTSADWPKNANPKSVDSDVSGQSLQVGLAADKMVTVENLTSLRFGTNSAGAQLVSPKLKHAVRPIAISATSFAKNKYKLDNRPTTFIICAPLPFSLANVAVLKKHFSVHGAVSNVEIEDSDEEECLKGHEDSKAMKMCSARVSFATRHAAERAFLNGKSWKGYNLEFTWVPSSTSTTSRSSGESSSALKGTLNAEVQSKDKTKHDKSQSGSNTKESNSSPCKSSTEVTDGIEKDSVFEVQSPNRSASCIPLEADKTRKKRLGIAGGRR